jgi:hypothetical protein
MDPGFRRDDKREWIPAFAGMTPMSGLRRNDNGEQPSPK